MRARPDRTRMLRRLILTSALAVPAALAAGGVATAIPGTDTASRASRTAAAALAAPGDPIDLCAKAGTLGLPGGASVPIAGFALKPAGVDCTDASVQASLPGPVLDVAEGESVAVNLTNALADPVALEIPGLSLDQGPTETAAGATMAYTFTASNPGTYLYESAADAGRQAARGLHGALIVRSATADQAYDDASSAYDREAIMVLSAVDPRLNANPATFAMTDWAPAYWLINGKAYPHTDDIAGAAGDRVLLRYVSAGPETVTMAMANGRARAIAQDAALLPNPFDVVAETVPAGSTTDALVTVPSSGRVVLYDRQLHLVNGAVGDAEHTAPDGFGGMVTSIHTP
jgi:FtsP/CotA-like multicopper oxidase with cupredoxin domain